MAAGQLLRRGRESFERLAWKDAYANLAAADRESALEAEDLDRLAVVAFLTGRDEESSEVLARAHRAWCARGEIGRAARSAFWLAFNMMHGGQPAQAAGWIARARRLLEDAALDCVEHGYLLMPVALRHVGEGNIAAACAAFGEAAQIGERFSETDLIALARQGRGRTLIKLGQTAEGINLLDEVMVAVTAGEVSPPIVGTIYCSVVEACRETFDLRRAGEWTAAFAAWLAGQPDVLPFRGQCLVYRAEIMQLHGAWGEAMAEAQRACEQFARSLSAPAVGAAFYQQGELFRLRGEMERAEAAYREAAQRERAPRPGLALLRLAQGQADVAVAAIRRVLEEAKDPRARFRALAAAVEIFLDVEDLEAARGAADELSAIAGRFEAPLLRAAALQCHGAVQLGEGDAKSALASLRAAWTTWHDLDAPYEGARVRVLIAHACRALGDEEMTAIELAAARQEFERLGALPDAARARNLEGAAPRGVAGLTAREVQVLKLVARGKTNRAIADALSISEKTVARHLSNIFTKLDVSSRAAATAFAYEHDLISPST